MLRPGLLVLLLLPSVFGCNRDADKTPDELLVEDTTLAIDLARANDALDDGGPDTSIGLTDDAPPLKPDQDPAPQATPAAIAAGNARDARDARDADLRAETPSRAEPVARSSGECSSPAAADQRRCLLSLLSQYDVGLNSAYRDLIQRLRRDAGVASGESDPASVRELRSAQRSWLVYRDRECRRRTRSREGELWAPVRARCLGALSDLRARELRSL